MEFSGGPFERLEILIGKDHLNILGKSAILILGLGGVGSFACEGLARSGIGTFILVDFDNISLTNFNRHTIALKNTIGMKKSMVMEQRIKSINTEAKVISFSEFLNPEKIRDLITGKFYEMPKIDFCLEAIDSLGPKINIIKNLFYSKIPFVSSMGAGGRINPFKIRTGFLSDVKLCSFAMRIKKRLKKDGIPISDIKVVYSDEPGIKPLARNKWDEGDLGRGRIRGKQGSICFVPAVFGLFMGYMAVDYIMNLPENKK